MAYLSNFKQSRVKGGKGQTREMGNESHPVWYNRAEFANDYFSGTYSCMSFGGSLRSLIYAK